MWSDRIPSFRSFDGPFTFTSARGVEGRCYLSVYEHRGTLPVVMYVICNRHTGGVTSGGRQTLN